jgi:NAD-dependent deacetylase
MDTSPAPASLEAIVDLLSSARKLAVMTGAGMSAESGIPTFRGEQSGLWARFDPQQLATPDAYRADKALVWGWYRWRSALVERALPNAGHRAIAALEALKPELVVVTQNVDDLHERAGSGDVVHLHGSLFSPRCFACERPYPRSPPSATGDPDPVLRVEPPDCPHCGGPVRPGVVWFGEPLPEQPWARAERVIKDCDVLLVVGTSGVVQPAASLPRHARQMGKPVVEVNPEASAITPIADLFYRGKAAEGLPKIVAAL